MSDELEIEILKKLKNLRKSKILDVGAGDLRHKLDIFYLLNIYIFQFSILYLF